MTELFDRDIEAHVPLLAGEEMEELPVWQRRTFNLERKRARDRKLKEVQARNRVRDIHQTQGYKISRKLRIRSEHLFAEGKNQHGLARARRRGLARVHSQLLLCAIVQNLKRLVTFTGRKGWAAAAAGSCTDFRPPMAHVRVVLAHSWAKIRSAVTNGSSAPLSHLTRWHFLACPRPSKRSLSSTGF